MSLSRHQARVIAEPGNPGQWLVTCDVCLWLEDIVGPWADREEAEQKVREHEQDPDPDAIYAMHLFFQHAKEFNAQRTEDRRRESDEELERERANYVFGKKERHE